jgi:chromosome partitioning protein
MRRIIVMNTKGGCGKTTIATNIASYYASQGFHTALFDYDAQRSSTHWLNLRTEESPEIYGVTAFRRETAGVTRSWQVRVPPETQRIVIDTPASMDRNDLMERVRGVDTILIPVLPSPIDTYAAADFIRDLLLVGKLRSEHTRVGIIPNRIRQHTLAFHALHRFLNSLNIPVVAQLQDSQLYVQAADRGMGVHELPDYRARRHRRTWHDLYQWVESGGPAPVR